MRMNDVFPGWLNGKGVFSLLLNSGTDVPWAGDETVRPNILDLEFHGNYAGGRTISPFLRAWKESHKTLLPYNPPYFPGEDTLELERLSEAIVLTHRHKWQKLWDTMSIVYNPIENYDMTETMIGTTSDSRTDTVQKSTSETVGETSHTDDDSTTGDNRTITGSGSHSLSNSNTRHGFNSTVGVPTDDQSGSGTQNESRTDTGSGSVSRDIDGTVNRTVTGSETGSVGTTGTGSTSHTLSRSGNIGVTTSQQMLQSERELWKWEYFTDVIFPDIASFLTVGVY